MKHSEEHYRLFFRRKADYYLNILEEFDPGRKAVFNLYAFFFGFFWMLYRRMYLECLQLIIVIMGETILEQMILVSLDATESTMTLIDRISMIVWGGLIVIFANRFYIDRANRKISKVLKLGLSEEETNNKIQSVGGVTLIPHLIILVLIVVMVFLGKEGYFDNL